MTEYTRQVIDPALLPDTKVLEDNSIQERNFISYPPTSATQLTSNGGEVRMHINQTDQFTGLFDSWLRAGFDVFKANKTTRYTAAEVIAPIHNFFAHLLDNARLQLNGQDVERVEEVGIINTMLRNILATVDENEYGLDSGFALDTSYRAKDGPENAITYDITTDVESVKDGLTTTKSDGFHKRRQFFTRYANTSTPGKFSLMFPLKDLFGFCRDYTKYLYGYSYTLVLTRKDIVNASRVAMQATPSIDLGVDSGDSPIITLEKLEWVVPHIRPSLEVQDKLYQQILNKVEYPIAYRPIRSAKYLVPGSGFTWNATSVQAGNEKPLYAVIGFVRESRQAGATTDDTLRDNAALFDDAKVKDIAVYANGLRVPQENRDHVGDEMKITDAYHDFQMFKHKFLGLPMGARSPISIHDFKLFNTMFVFDLTKLPEQMRSGTVNITVKTTFNTNPAANTFSAHLALFTKSVLIARSDGSRYTLVAQ